LIFEHEIPSGSRLYFGESAKIKREIELKASTLLEKRGYQEMVTPIFSYHQHESFNDTKELIRLNDANNHKVTLRADSTADIVRIATKRLGRSTKLKKWFYIQPVYRFPTKEQYQIGAEALEGNFIDIVNDAVAILKELEITPLLQIANIAIPKILSESYGIDLNDIRVMNIKKLLSSGYSWLESLIHIHSPKELEDLSIYPKAIGKELELIKETIKEIDYNSILVSPLYYAPMRYYNRLVFRAFEDNRLYARGGSYKIEDISASGFAILTDACIAKKMQKG